MPAIVDKKKILTYCRLFSSIDSRVINMTEKKSVYNNGIAAPLPRIIMAIERIEPNIYFQLSPDFKIKYRNQGKKQKWVKGIWPILKCPPKYELPK